MNEGKIDGCDGASLFERYRLYRRLSLDIQSAALNNLPRQALLDQAKRIGLSDGKELLLNNPVELALVFDLAVYTAKEGRTRAIDWCARSRAKNATPEEALVLAGLCAARFSLFRMKAKIEPVGALLEDVMRGDEIRLLHDGLEKAAQPGDVAAIRVAPIGEFFIPCSAILPIYAKIADGLVGKFTDGERAALADHPRFAASVYKTSITFGLTDNLRTEEGGILKGDRTCPAPAGASHCRSVNRRLSEKSNVVEIQAVTGSEMVAVVSTDHSWPIDRQCVVAAVSRVG